MIKKLNSWYLCCCCKSLIRDVIQHEGHDEIEHGSPVPNRSPVPTDESNINLDLSNLDTRDISSMEKSERLKVMESELTVTNALNPTANT